MTNQIKREDIATGLSYDALTAAFEREMGKFDEQAAQTLIQQKAPWNTVEETINEMAGPHGLMIFFKADQAKSSRCTMP